MKFTLNNNDVTTIETDCIVIGIQDESPLEGSAAVINEASGGAIQALVDSGDIDPTWKSTTLLHGLNGVKASRVLAVGCGSKEKFDKVRYGTSCATAGTFLRDHVSDNAHICLHELQVAGTDTHWRIRHAAVCIDSANYLYTATKAPKKHDHDPLSSISLNAGSEMQGAIDEALGFATGYRRSRELGNLPPNICTPAYLARQAKEIAKQYANVSVEILKRKQMAELKMSALLAVGQGSANGPRLVILKYSGADKGQAPVVLVGKGITFDTGGISLKAGANMEQMKFDMGGAAGVIGAFEACAQMQLPINLVMVVAAAENMPDGKAYRPGDVLTSMSGKTIEVLNTDAEGRLVLCDALTYSQRFEPKVIIDVATLTGACVVALGHHASAVMSKHDDLADEIIAAGQQCVDRAWRMPLWEDYQVQIKSNFADMKNVGGMAAGSVTAACFLSRFTKGQRWAHIDCAGSTWIWGGSGGSTGRPAGLLTQFLINQAS